MPSLSPDAWLKAAETGDLPTIQFYLNQGFDVQTFKGHFRQTALHRACRFNRLDVVHLLLSHEADMNTYDRCFLPRSF